VTPPSAAELLVRRTSGLGRRRRSPEGVVMSARGPRRRTGRGRCHRLDGGNRISACAETAIERSIPGHVSCRATVAGRARSTRRSRNSCTPARDACDSAIISAARPTRRSSGAERRRRFRPYLVRKVRTRISDEGVTDRTTLADDFGVGRGAAGSGTGDGADGDARRGSAGRLARSRTSRMS